MKTLTSNETALSQQVLADEEWTVSVVRSGALFRFVVEAIATQPPSNGLGAYRYPTEIYRSGLYESETAAEEAVTAYLSELR